MCSLIPSATIPFEWVQRDIFYQLDGKKLAAKCSTGVIRLYLIRTDPSSQKSLKGVGVSGSARCLDEWQDAARKELTQMQSGQDQTKSQNPSSRKTCFRA